VVTIRSSIWASGVALEEHIGKRKRLWRRLNALTAKPQLQRIGGAS
jgi:hypothetical protein